MKRILVTQSDRVVTQGMAGVLMDQGFEVESVYNTGEALQKVASESWDLVILDIITPQKDSLEACQYVREHTTTPVVILSAQGQDEHVVQGLDAGADDYLVKPISAKVFLARVYALLRRAGRARGKTQNGMLKLGDLIVDLDRCEASVRGEPVKLTASEFRLLSCLAKNPGRVLSSRSLVREIQGYDCSAQDAQGIIKVHVHNLRKKMKLDSKKPPHILNVRGFGYMFERRDSSREAGVNQILT